MVAFNKNTDLPPGIDSVEKLHVWSAMVLNHIAPTLSYVEASGQAQRVTSNGLFYITASDPPAWRNIARTSLPVSPDWQIGDTAVWTHVQAISSASIPAGFKD